MAWPLYNNIGEKIKGLAVFEFAIGVAASIIYGMFVGANDLEKSLGEILLIIVLGVVASWLSSLLIYGFGELITRVINIDERQANATPPNNTSEYANKGDTQL